MVIQMLRKKKLYSLQERERDRDWWEYKKNHRDIIASKVGGYLVRIHSPGPILEFTFGFED